MMGCCYSLRAVFKVRGVYLVQARLILTGQSERQLIVEVDLRHCVLAIVLLEV